MFLRPWDVVVRNTDLAFQLSLPQWTQHIASVALAFGLRLSVACVRTCIVTEEGAPLPRRLGREGACHVEIGTSPVPDSQHVEEVALVDRATDKVPNCPRPPRGWAPAKNGKSDSTRTSISVVSQPWDRGSDATATRERA